MTIAWLGGTAIMVIGSYLIDVAGPWIFYSGFAVMIGICLSLFGNDKMREREQKT